MSDKPEALRLADELERVYGYPDTDAAAAELRRLHELNQGLLDALDAALKLIGIVWPIEGDVALKARAAIVKATGSES